jgi:hypothetical protein
MKICPIFLLWVLAAGTAGLSLEEQNKVNLSVLEMQLKMQFSLPDGQNIFLYALEKLPDGQASNEDIEAVVGADYDLFKKQWASAKLKALGLVSRVMETLKQHYVAGNPKTLSLFSDYFQLMQLNLSPETVFLNRESYVIFGELEEGLVTQIYTDLSKIYTIWRPLKLVLDEKRGEDFKEIKKVVAIKNPNYEPLEMDIGANTVTTALESEVAEEETPQEEHFEDSYDFSGSNVEPETPMDDDNNTVLRSATELKLFSFMQQSNRLARERQLLQCTGVLQAIAVSLIAVAFC